MININGIRKSYGDAEILKGIDLEVKDGEVIVIIGPSGSGKSTFLRCLNYLETPDAGTIKIDDFKIDAKNYTKNNVKELRSKSAMVFQNFNLFNNRTVLENVMEGLITVKKMSKRESEETALSLLKKVNMDMKKDSYPKNLSGGQKQRVSIARAIAMNPEFILFDEPTSALDPEMVLDVLNLIKDLAKENRTMIIVTHEISFAKDVADVIVFMDEGIIIEKGSTDEVLLNPKESRTKEFLSNVHFK
ncbi:amino acid ABC transporter ATP-binding protein [Clostridium butyricum]|uniref:amino acid ABC transporter ATP-binding protein n=1 Tax=Clostridium butyricum TaxID=1492 RepID=UPI00168A973C|nr:amino acid ABC transporter ATP-binding protein [Clostridium butyricum]MBZ0312202.1 amino acid ABC transporter ATP-binding protein [Clostridium butyricum]MDB2151152.1 amino acid ABC transporter ATP-binding protein [Clostridium butyricum]